eukprot:scaffold75536_cov17-Tisochrysis_lutea.AAC.1
MSDEKSRQGQNRGRVMVNTRPVSHMASLTNSKLLGTTPPAATYILAQERRARSTRSAWQHGSKDRKTGQHGSSALTRMLSTQSQGAPSHRMRTGISQDAHGLSRARSLALPHFSTLQPLMPASTAVRDWINKHEHT